VILGVGHFKRAQAGHSSLAQSVYVDKEKTTATIHGCFSKADKVVQPGVQGAAGFHSRCS
jgi:hypothetical protein